MESKRRHNPGRVDGLVSVGEVKFIWERNSWAQHRRDLDNLSSESMPRLSPPATAAYWTVWNAAIERIGRAEPGYTRIRYEDPVADPRPNFESIVTLQVSQGSASRSSTSGRWSLRLVTLFRAIPSGSAREVFDS